MEIHKNIIAIMEHLLRSADFCTLTLASDHTTGTGFYLGFSDVQKLCIVCLIPTVKRLLLGGKGSTGITERWNM